MARINHQSNFATNLTSNTAASDTTSPLNAIPSIDAPFYLAFDATNINGHYEVKACTSKTATNVNHTALSYAHTTAEEVRLVIPAEEMNNLGTPVEQVDGVWVAWTPTWTNLTVGNGTVEARYTQIGKTVHFKLIFKFGAGSAMGNANFTLPVTAKALETTAGEQIIGNGSMYDSGGGSYMSVCALFNTTTAKIYSLGVNGTTINKAIPSATAPFTWATNDEYIAAGTYEAA